MSAYQSPTPKRDAAAAIAAAILIGFCTLRIISALAL